MNRGYNGNDIEVVVSRCQSGKLRPDPNTKFGRAWQLSEIIFLAVVGIATVLVQIETVADLGTSREHVRTSLQSLRAMVFEVYDVITLLSIEMEQFYEYNQGSYDLFQLKAQNAMRNVDAKLLMIDDWPTDFSALTSAQRVNITSTYEMRLAIRAHRELRKAANGTTEDEVIKFYSGLIDNLALLTRANTLNSIRFNGWQEFFSMSYVYQAYINFKKYSMLVKKMADDDRNVYFSDPVYQSALLFYWKYVDFTKIAARISPVTEAKMQNITEQDAMKQLDSLNEMVMHQEFVKLSGEEWTATTSKHDLNLLWVLQFLQSRAEEAMDRSARAWSNQESTSVGILTSACIITLICLFVHIVATSKLQNRVIEANQSLDLLMESFTIINDYIPKSSSVSSGPRRMVSSYVPRYFQDTCILVMDIPNIQTVIGELDGEALVEKMTCFYEIVEKRLHKFNCFKLDVFGESILLASGVGETHPTDHVSELLYIGLMFLKDFSDHVGDVEQNETSKTAKTAKGPTTAERTRLWIRVGVHCGPCYATVVHVRIPQVTIFGTVIKVAADVHANSLPMKTLVSSAVCNRLIKSGINSFTFIERGLPLYHEREEEHKAGPYYWASWADDDSLADEDILSVASLAADMPSSDDEGDEDKEEDEREKSAYE